MTANSGSPSQTTHSVPGLRLEGWEGARRQHRLACQGLIPWCVHFAPKCLAVDQALGPEKAAFTGQRIAFEEIQAVDRQQESRSPAGFT